MHDTSPGRSSLASFLTATVLALALLVPNSAYAQLTLDVIGDLPGGPPPQSHESHATNVSADGSVVIGKGLAETFPEGFRWQNGVMTRLGPSPRGGVFEFVSGISGDGKIVVGIEGGNAANTSLLWKNGIVSYISPTPTGFVPYPQALSMDGSVMAGLMKDPRTGFRHAFRMKDGIVTSLGHLPSNYHPDSGAVAISLDGTVVVGWTTSGSGKEAFIWKNGVMTGLGDLPGHEFSSSASSVSADGTVVVGTGRSTQGVEAFRWANGVMTGLGDLPGEPFVSEAYSVCADGSVVIGAGNHYYAQESFLWRADVGMVKLRSLLVALGVTELRKQRGFGARSLSADGTTLVGNIRDTGPYTMDGGACRLRANNPGGFRTIGAGQKFVSANLILEGTSTSSPIREVSFELRPVSGIGPTITFVRDIGPYPQQQDFMFLTSSGRYTLTARVPGYLTQVVNVDVSGSGSLILPDITLLAGDINNDNKVNLTDLIRLRSNYGKTGTNLAGDFNNDGKVNLTDLILFRGNYGKQGAQ